MKPGQVAHFAGAVSAALVAGLNGLDFSDLPTSSATARAEPQPITYRRIRLPAGDPLGARLAALPPREAMAALQASQGAPGAARPSSSSSASSPRARPAQPIELPPRAAEAVIAEAQRRHVGNLTPAEQAHARELGFSTPGAYAAARDAGRLMAAPLAASSRAALASGITVGARIAAEMAIGGCPGNATARAPTLAEAAPAGVIRFSGVEIGALAALAASPRPRALTPETMTQAQYQIAARFSKTPAQFCAEHNSLFRLT